MSCARTSGGLSHVARFRAAATSATYRPSIRRRISSIARGRGVVVLSPNDDKTGIPLLPLLPGRKTSAIFFSTGVPKKKERHSQVGMVSESEVT